MPVRTWVISYSSPYLIKIKACNTRPAYLILFLWNYRKAMCALLLPALLPARHTGEITSKLETSLHPASAGRMTAKASLSLARLLSSCHTITAWWVPGKLPLHSRHCCSQHQYHCADGTGCWGHCSSPARTASFIIQLSIISEYIQTHHVWSWWFSKVLPHAFFQQLIPVMTMEETHTHPLDTQLLLCQPAKRHLHFAFSPFPQLGGSPPKACKNQGGILLLSRHQQIPSTQNNFRGL